MLESAFQRAHRVDATYGYLAPVLGAGNFDFVNQKAVWPSMGNYCSGGTFNSALLSCNSIAILPEEMSRECLEELSDQWYDRNYWRNIQNSTQAIDEEIEAFNGEVGL